MGKPYVRPDGSWRRGDPYHTGPVVERHELEAGPVRPQGIFERAYASVIRGDRTLEKKYIGALRESLLQDEPRADPARRDKVSTDPCDVCDERKAANRDAAKGIDANALIQQYGSPGMAERYTGIPRSTLRDIQKRQQLAAAAKVAAGAGVVVLGVFGLKKLLGPTDPPKEA